MKFLVPLLAILGYVSAFNASLEPRHVQRKRSVLRASSQMETFERAVECAENYGYCNLDELEDLSDGK